MTDFLEQVAFDDETGLVPAVVQSAEDDRVLMVAYMDDEALRRTLDGDRVTFWSRSRGELWPKGETSGNWLEAVEVRTDCDGDALLVRARPHGPVCHTGEATCFDAGSRTRAPSPEETAGGDGPSGSGRLRAGPESGGDADVGRPGADPSPAPVLASVLEEVVRVVAERDEERPDGSYTARLLEEGPSAAAHKVREEALEVVEAALEDPDQLRPLAEESADLLYHLVVLWRGAGLDPDGVGGILAERRQETEG